MASTAHTPMLNAAAVRTKSRRDMLNLRRHRSVSCSASAMTASWSRVGGGGMNSPFEHGSTSTGNASLGSGHERFQRGIIQ